MIDKHFAACALVFIAVQYLLTSAAGAVIVTSVFFGFVAGSVLMIFMVSEILIIRIGWLMFTADAIENIQRLVIMYPRAAEYALCQHLGYPSVHEGIGHIVRMFRNEIIRNYHLIGPLSHVG